LEKDWKPKRKQSCRKAFRHRFDWLEPGFSVWLQGRFVHDKTAHQALPLNGSLRRYSSHGALRGRLDQPLEDGLLADRLGRLSRAKCLQSGLRSSNSCWQFEVQGAKFEVRSF
jgi:hypothetical protein